MDKKQETKTMLANFIEEMKDRIVLVQHNDLLPYREKTERIDDYQYHIRRALEVLVELEKDYVA